MNPNDLRNLVATPGVISREDIQRLAVIYGKQNIVPIPLFDTQDVANGNALTTLQFFSNTRGAQGIAITNMEQPNQLISGKFFVVEELGLDVVPTGVFAAASMADAKILTHNKSTYTLKINQVEYAQGLVKDLIGGGLFGWGSTTADVNYFSPGYRKPAALYPAIVIPTQTQFSLQFDYAAAPNPAATVTLRPYLRGKLVRQTSA